MRVEFTPEVFQGGPEILASVLNLLDCFAKNHHEWAPKPAEIEAAKSYLRQHAPTLADTFTALGTKALVAATAWRKSADADLVRAEPHTLAEIADDLRHPAVLVVEDSTSDGCFIKAIATVFGTTRVIAALDERRLAIRHAGGERLPQVVKDEIGCFRRIIRVTALLDSDRWGPGQHTKSHAKAENLRADGIEVHVLELREAENYVPTRVLAVTCRSGRAAHKISALKSLTTDQRGYFDMKKGFGPESGPPRIPPAQDELYADVDEATRLALRGGFGNDLLRTLERHCDSLSLHDFAKLGRRIESELRELLAKIEKVL